MSAEKKQVLPYPLKLLGTLEALGLAGSISSAVTASATETQAAATPLTSMFNVVSTAGATDAVLLKDLLPGEAQFIKNTSGQAIKIFPPEDRSIDGGTVDAVDAVNMADGDTRFYVGAEDGIDIISFVMNVPAHAN